MVIPLPGCPSGIRHMTFSIAGGISRGSTCSDLKVISYSFTSMRQIPSKMLTGISNCRGSSSDAGFLGGTSCNSPFVVSGRRLGVHLASTLQRHSRPGQPMMNGGVEDRPSCRFPYPDDLREHPCEPWLCRCLPRGKILVSSHFGGLNPGI